MMIVVAMLMCTVSHRLRFSPRIVIHNQCLNTKLMSPVYFGDGAVCPKLSNQRIDIGAKMNASFKINTIQNEFGGALLFKLQKYADSQYNMDASITETNKSESTHAYMLVIWRMKDFELFARVVLVEHTKAFTWNEDRLKKLYDRIFGWFKEYDDTISDTWLVNNNMVLKTSFKVRWSRENLLGILGLKKARTSKENFELSISISEEKSADYTMRPFRINLER
jgi:hypothetical protein